MAKALPTDAMDVMPKELMAGIGEVVARWGYLEYQLSVVIREACRVEKETGRLLLGGQTAQAMCAIMRTLAKTDRWVKDAPTRAAIAALAAKVETAKGARNAFAHGVFGHGADPGSYARWNFADKSKLAPELVVITETSLRNEAKVARDLWTKAQEITKTLKAQRRARA